MNSIQGHLLNLALSAGLTAKQGYTLARPSILTKLEMTSVLGLAMEALL